MPGYIRYWDGSQWVAGTSKPMPGAETEAGASAQGDSGPAAQASAQDADTVSSAADDGAAFPASGDLGSGAVAFAMPVSPVSPVAPVAPVTEIGEPVGHAFGPAAHFGGDQAAEGVTPLFTARAGDVGDSRGTWDS